MNYIELNLIHKQKMDTLCNNPEHFEWEDTTFMDYLKGSLPRLRNTSSNSAITGLFHSLTKKYSSYSFYDSEPIAFISEIEKIIDEIRKKNITIDEAKEVAINKLEEVGFNSNIIKQEERKTYNNENIDYLFTTETEYEITIEGSTGQFFAIRNCKEFKQDENKAYTLEEAKEIADKYFKQFGFDKDGFEFTKVQVDVGPDVKKGGEQTRGSRLEVRYNKKYDNQISSSQYVNIVLDTGLEDRFESIMTKNEPFENNEYIITKDEAVSKAKEYDKNITDMKIAETKAEKKIVKINDKAYSRMQNYKEFYEPMQNENFDNSKYNYYAVDEKLRNAWVVVLKYDDKYFTDDVVKRYSEGAFTYYVDATTGEIIGGEILDGLAYSF